MIKVFVDDTRPAPEGWVLLRTIREAEDFIVENAENISHIDFDYYMNDAGAQTGLMLIERLLSSDVNVFHQPRNHYTCHSSDADCNERMNDVLDRHMNVVGHISIVDTQKPNISRLQRLRSSKGHR